MIYRFSWPYVDRKARAKKNYHWKKRCEIEDYWDRSSRRYGRGIRMQGDVKALGKGPVRLG